MSCQWVVSCPYCQSYNVDDLGNRLSKDRTETIWDFTCLDCDLNFEAIEPDDGDDDEEDTPIPIATPPPSPTN